jgi:hypothetical protein
VIPGPVIPGPVVPVRTLNSGYQIPLLGLATLDLGEDAAVHSDLRVEF